MSREESPKPQRPDESNKENHLGNFKHKNPHQIPPLQTE